MCNMLGVTQAGTQGMVIITSQDALGYARNQGHTNEVGHAVYVDLLHLIKSYMIMYTEKQR